MTRAEKKEYIDDLAEKLAEAGMFYLADTTGLSAEKTNELRRQCFEKDIQFKVVKNTLLKRAMDQVEAYEYNQELYDTLEGPTSIMFTDVAKVPAGIMKEFRKTSEKPVLKAAWIEEATYIGDDKMKELAELKSKEELVGDIVSLLQSPAKNVISSLQSGGDKLSGIVKTLSDKAEG